MAFLVASDPRERPAPAVAARAFSLGRDERRWLLGLVVVTLCSWGRWAATGSLKVDESYPSAVAGTILLGALVAGYALLVTGWKGLLERPTVAPRRLAFAGLGVTALMLPMLSNDVFSMFAYGSLAARGQDVFTTASTLRESVWYPWIGARWAGSACVYGPATLVTMLPSSLAGGHPWLALLALRLTWFAPLALVMELSFRWFKDRPFFHAMVWLNPLFLLEGPGQLHTDLLGVVAVTAGILLQGRGKVKAGWVSYGLAFLGKYSFALAGPWFWLSGARTNREKALRVPAIMAIVATLAVAIFAPFWRGPATVTEPLRTLAEMNPGGTLTEFAGHLVQLARGGSVSPPDMPVAEAIALDRATHGTTWAATSLLLGIVAVWIGARVLRAMLRRTAGDETIALGTGVLVVLVATLASRRFEPWYLMGALPFFGLSCPPEWRRWWVAAVAFSVAPTFMNVLPRTASILPVWSVLTTVGVMLVFLSSFRARYLSFGEFDGPPAEAESPILAGSDTFQPAVEE